MSEVYFVFNCHFDFPGSAAHQTPGFLAEKKNKIENFKCNHKFLFNGWVSHTGTLMAFRLQNHFSLHPPK